MTQEKHGVRNLGVPVPTVTAPALHRARWSVETWATVITAACTVLTLLVAVLIGLHGMKTAEKTVDALTASINQSNLLTIYNLNLDSSKFFEANPLLFKFFDRSKHKPVTDAELRAEYDKLDEKQKVLVELGCEKVADLMQVIFLQRQKLPVEDWNNWWRSMCDQYDESPMLREYITRRKNWYAFLNAIQPAKREQYFIRGESR